MYTFDELITAVSEIEGVLNSRPLTYIASDDLEEPLTPAHLITGRRILNLPDAFYLQDVEEGDVEITTIHLTERLVHLNQVLEEFWRRWTTEYMLELRESHRHRQKVDKEVPVKKGDVVLIYDEDSPRGFWKIAHIKSLIMGKDGQARGAILRVGTTKDRETILQRPLQKLYPLEVGSSDIEEEEAHDDNASERSTSDEVSNEEEQTERDIETNEPKRPRRAAAMESRSRTQAVAMFEQDELSD